MGLTREAFLHKEYQFPGKQKVLLIVHACVAGSFHPGHTMRKHSESC